MMKTNFKRILAMLMLVVLTIPMMIGCSEEPKSTGNSNSVTVTDQLGREVTIEGNVEKIVSTYYITSSLLIALGAKDHVVGIEAKADTREIYKKAAPEFLELPAVGSGKGINIEEIANLAPDLVIIPLRLKESVEKLEALNIPVLVVDPETMDNFTACIELIGKAIGQDKRAKELLDYYNNKIEMIKKKTGNIEDKPSVYLSAGSSYLSTCTSKMYQNDLIHMAGGNNVSKNLQDGYWANVSVEELIKWNPEYMFMVGYASYTKEEVVSDSKINNIEAIKNDNLFVFPSILEPWDYPTPSSVLGILWLTNKLHPEVYTKKEFEKEAKNFYKEFYNIDITSEEMGN
ncbi:MAG: ABC transporter substrate-binding protein [Clostridium sp.]